MLVQVLISKISQNSFAKKCDGDVDQKLISTIEEQETSKANSKTQMEMEKFIECLILILRVGVECFEESPRERITIVDATKKLHLIKEMLLGRRISTTVQIAQIE
ncbi:hypothetical protein ACSBR1_035319 [Camellia fascicularis]